METEVTDLRRKHTDPYFWACFLAYFLIGAGILGGVIGVIETYSLAGAHTGIMAILMGLLIFIGVDNRRLRKRNDELERIIHTTENREHQD